MKSLLLGALALTLASPRLRAQPSLEEAQAAFNSARSSQDFSRAALAFEALAASWPNAGMEYNAGNARFRSGDLGLAILHYKRALRLDPRHAEARANLSAARRKRLDQAEAAGPTIMERLAFWHRLLSAKEKFSLGLGFWILGWLPLLVQLFRPLPWLRTLAAFCLLPAAGLVLSLAVQLWSESRHPEAVVQAPEVFLRLGGAERYDPAVKEPLHPGTELQILEARGAWFRVRLNKDISGWLPQDSLALVPPPGPAPK